MKKKASDLQIGDRISPPSGERRWMQCLPTVIQVEEGKTDRGGKWLDVRVSFPSPFVEGKISLTTFSYRPDTRITVHKTEEM